MEATIVADDPVSWLKTMFDPKYDWMYNTVPQKITGAPFFWPRYAQPHLSDELLIVRRVEGEVSAGPP